MLSRLRIRTKLLLAPGVVLVLQVLVSGGACLAMLRQNESIESIVRERAARIRTAADVGSSAQRVHAQAYQVLTWISGSFPQSRVAPLVHELQAQQAAVERGFATLAGQMRDNPAGRRSVEQARAAWARYVPAVSDVIEIARLDQSISANAMSRAESAFAVVAQRLALVARREQELSEQASSAASDDFHLAATLIPLLVSVSIAASLAITMAVRRALLAGIAGIEAAAQGLASGDLTVRPCVDGSDEIAATSRALDEGIRSLSGNLRGVLDSARAIGAASREIGIRRAGLPPRASVRSASAQGADAVQALAAALVGHADSAHAAHRLAQALEAQALEGGQLTHRMVASMDDVRRALARLDEVGSRLEAALVADLDGASRVPGARQALAAVHEARALARQALAAGEGGGALAAQAGACLAGLVDTARAMDGIALGILDASTARARELAGATEAILEADTLSRQGNRMVEDAALAARALQQQAESLARSVAAFRLDAACLAAPNETAPPDADLRRAGRAGQPYLMLVK